MIENSTEPTLIPPPAPPEQQQELNPYNNRNHEAGQPITSKSDVLAVAGLLGNVSRELTHIDKQNVGGDSEFIKAKKLDPHQTLQQIVGAGPTTINQATMTAPIPMTQTQQPPVVTHQAPPPVVPSGDLERRVEKLEKLADNQNKPLKFKRGVSYDVSTSKIKGNFKDPQDIIDIVFSELAKQTRSITIKLNDTTKDR